MKKFTFCLLIALLFICACEAQFKNETLQVEIPTVTDAPISTANQCSINFTPMPSQTAPISTSNTLDKAMEWYLSEKHSRMYLEGDYFVSSYRILDSKELTDTVIIYAHIHCKWIALDGEVISGGAGPVALSFKKNNDAYLFEKVIVSDKEFFFSPEIPQEVRDMVSDAPYFDEMISEVERDVASFLDAGR